MKHNQLLFIAIALVLGIAFFGCKKDPQETLTPMITESNVEVTATTATFTWTVDWPGKKISVVEVSENEDMSSALRFGSEEELNKKDFLVTATNLKPATKYYYHYLVWNHNYEGNEFVMETKWFTTDSDLPKVTTIPVSEVTWTTALGGGNVTDDCGSEVTERGICWAENPKPTLSDEHQTSGSGNGIFSVLMENLEPNKTYYVRAYAKNEKGVGYGEDESFITNETLLPEVTTFEVTDITWRTAIGGGEVTNENGAEVTERGICWSTEHNPDMSSSHANSGSGLGTFSVDMVELIAGTMYYVRAYAKNSAGVKYSENEVSFTTEAPVLPEVTTSTVTNVSYTSAVCGGSVNNPDGTLVQYQGVCWGRNENPEETDTHIQCASTLGTFSETMLNLDPGTTYHVRAYARNNVGISYGEDVIFTTKTLTGPTVKINSITGITQTSAIAKAEVTDEGGAAVTKRGICWGVSHNPTLINNIGNATNGTGLGSYTINMTNLNPYTKYYVRAYAINNVDTIYSNEKSFTTHAIPPTGAIDGMFSVSNSKKIWFSQGNLQYQPTSGTWRFAADQYEYMGSNNGHISETYNGWIDLFGWGTSGNNHGAVCYQPWSISTQDGDYYAYGSYLYNLYDQTGVADWGYNAISNGGNHVDKWRTLTIEEWDYLLNTRSTPSGVRYAMAIVNSEYGVVILPDDWSSEIYNFEYINGQSNKINDISNNTWNNVLEPAGVVFLPVAGTRSGTTYSKYWDFNWSGTTTRHYDCSYASASSHGDYIGYLSVNFSYWFGGSSSGTSASASIKQDGSRGTGRSVRLVQDIQ